MTYFVTIVLSYQAKCLAPNRTEETEELGEDWLSEITSKMIGYKQNMMEANSETLTDMLTKRVKPSSVLGSKIRLRPSVTSSPSGQACPCPQKYAKNNYRISEIN